MKSKWVLLSVLSCVLAASCSQSPMTEESGNANIFEQPTVVDSVEFNQAMNSLITSSSAWPSLATNMKKRAVEVVISLYNVRENAAVLKSPEFYVQKIDESLSQNSNLQNLPFPELFKILAVMEYDYYNGQNKDDLAREVLGEKLFESNKKRLEELAAAGQQ